MKVPKVPTPLTASRTLGFDDIEADTSMDKFGKWEHDDAPVKISYMRNNAESVHISKD